MEVKATTKSIRLAPRKVRAVARLVRGKNVDEAINQLEFTVKRPALPIQKLINSAIANAEHNFSMVRSNLYIKDLQVDEGVKLKRFLPKAFGMTARIQKKTSHIRLVLDERVAGLKKQPGESKKKESHVHEHEKSKEIKMTEKRPEVKEELGKKTKGGFLKKVFQRKAV